VQEPGVSGAGSQRESAGLENDLVASRARLYEAAQSEGRLLLRLDPKLIRPTEFQNRDSHAFLIHDPQFIELAKSIKAHGQETPIRVRSIAGADAFEYEVISGHRRHAACMALDAATNNGFRVLAILDSAASDNRALVLKMYRENAERVDLSAHETGLMFKQWLAADLFPTQEAIAKAVGKSPQTVGKYIALAGLPDYLIKAFRDPRHISLRWGSDLSRLIETAAAASQVVAEELAARKPAPSAEQVYQTLLNVRRRPGASLPSLAIDAAAVEPEVRNTAVQVTGRKNRFVIRLQDSLPRGQRQRFQRDLETWLAGWFKQQP
jgi:ParB family transcriptional regulator, chromosome partitioning protein